MTLHDQKTFPSLQQGGAGVPSTNKRLKATASSVTIAGPYILKAVASGPISPLAGAGLSHKITSQRPNFGELKPLGDDSFDKPARMETRLRMGGRKQEVQYT